MRSMTRKKHWARRGTLSSDENVAHSSKSLSGAALSQNENPFAWILMDSECSNEAVRRKIWSFRERE